MTAKHLVGMIALGATVLHSVVRAEDAESPWLGDMDVTVGFDDNVGRAQFERDKAREYIGSISVNYGYDWEISLKQALSMKLTAEQETHEIMKGLNRTTVGGEANFRWQHSLGFGAPFFGFILRAQEHDTEFDQRDISESSAQLQMTKRLTDRLTWTIGSDYRQADSDTVAFDTKQVRLFNNFDYTLDDQWLAYFTLGLIKGDITSSAQTEFCNGLPAIDIMPLVEAATPFIEDDLAFNDALCGKWMAYKIPAYTQSYNLGLNLGVDHSMSLDISMLYVESQADVDLTFDEDIEYDRTIWRVTLLMQF